MQAAGSCPLSCSLLASDKCTTVRKPNDAGMMMSRVYIKLKVHTL